MQNNHKYQYVCLKTKDIWEYKYKNIFMYMNTKNYIDPFTDFLIFGYISQCAIL